jgi:Serine dehydrogenase proteinase
MMIGMRARILTPWLWADWAERSAAKLAPKCSAKVNERESLRWLQRRDGTESKEGLDMGKRMPQTDTVKEFKDKIQLLEKARNSRIYCMIHHGRAHICHPSMKALFTNRQDAGEGDRLEILIHSPGGHPDYAYQIMKFFRRRYTEVNIIVPLMAKSAATLMCLGADKVFIGEFGDLGPIDVQIDDPVDKGEKAPSPLDEFKSLEYMRDMAIEWMAYYAGLSHEDFGMSIRQGLEQSVPLVTGLMRPILSQIDPLEVGSHRRALAIAEEYGKRMLELVGESNDGLVHELVWEYPSHSFCIDFEEADRIGLPVERLSPEEDQQFCEAILKLDRGHYHGFASSKTQQTAVAARPPKPATPMPKRRNATDGTAGGNNGGSNDIGQGASETPTKDDIETAGSETPAS